MKKLIVAGALALTMGCGLSPVQKFDQAHGIYNAVADGALDYAEHPMADAKAREAIKQIVLRTGPVVVRGSAVIDKVAAGGEITSIEELYIQWGKEAVDEALRQLNDFYGIEEVR